MTFSNFLSLMNSTAVHGGVEPTVGCVESKLDKSVIKLDGHRKVDKVCVGKMNN